MKLTLQHLNLRSLDMIDAWVEKQLRALGATRQIDEANVRLVRLENASPAYQVHVHLVTPGPDVFAESRDHTLRAAFAKAMTQLREARKRSIVFARDIYARASAPFQSISPWSRGGLNESSRCGGLCGVPESKYRRSQTAAKTQTS